MKIAFVGKAGSGKTTIAKELQARHAFRKFAFADKLKEIATMLKGAPLNKFEFRDRELLQKLGTEIGRNYDPDIWIKHIDKDIKDFIAECTKKYESIPKEDREMFVNLPKIVIDDMRFLNEAAWAKNNRFIIIRINGRGYNLKSELANHRSEIEQEQIQVDFELDNSGTLDETMAKLYEYLKIYEKF
jgi:hypothetical protein